jgi:hypothetical protein
MKAILIPGNGGGSPQDNWFPYLERELPKIGIEVVNRQFPDAVMARSEYWLPFIKELDADEQTILIGHSSGAVAAMRYAETNKIIGSVLIGASHTDLGLESERVSHYYDRPWEWDAIKRNQKWIIEFASTDDPFIPIDEARYIAEHLGLGTDYHEYADRGHFGHPEPLLAFPELVEALEAKN